MSGGSVDVCKTRWCVFVKLSTKSPALNFVSLKNQQTHLLSFVNWTFHKFFLIQMLQSHYLFWEAVFCLDRRLRFFCKRVHIYHTSSCKLSESGICQIHAGYLAVRWNLSSSSWFAFFQYKKKRFLVLPHLKNHPVSLNKPILHSNNQSLCFSNISLSPPACLSDNRPQ